MTTTKPLTQTIAGMFQFLADDRNVASICTGPMVSIEGGKTQVLHCLDCGCEVTIAAAHIQARTPNPVTPLPAVDIAGQITDHINAVSDAFLQGNALLRLLEMAQCVPPWTFELRSSIKAFEEATQHLKALKDILGVEAGIEDDETLVMRAVPREAGVR